MSEYNDSSIKVLSDIEHIRTRSSMYISTDRPSYQMWTEIADNAVDEAMNGYADRIEFTVNYETSCITVEDNGRGLPQGMNKDLGKPTIYAIYQKLNAGGKYDQDSYAMSGGLNGVGSTVVNALSKELHVFTWRDKSYVAVDFEYGQDKGYKKEKDGGLLGSGTRVMYQIDTDHHLFTDSLQDYEADIIDKVHLLKTLIPNVTIIYNGQEVQSQDFRDFLSLSKDPLLEQGILIERKNLIVALNWSKDTNKSTQRCYCNSIYTHNGGDHEKAVYDGVRDAVGTEDTLLGINIAVSVMYPGVEYDSQAKLKAISKSMRTFVKDSVRDDLKSFFRKNPDIKEKVLSLAKSKRNELSKRNNKSSVRRDKKTTFLNALGSSAFSDCKTKNRDDAELYIVEGKSAAGSARQARNVETQAVAPLRGKFINAYTSDVAGLFKNQEVQMLLSSIDCGAFQDINVAKSRYGKIIIMADADPDGKNISCLLLSFFLKVAPELIEHGYVYLALPPLYGATIEGKFVPINTEELKNEYLSKGHRITRFKGLGEMNPEQLNIACMNPETRSIIQITSTEHCADVVEKIMGGDSSYRKQLLIQTGVLDE